jgi:macrolide-specific efflux system membrane fusion protein
LLVNLVLGLLVLGAAGWSVLLVRGTGTTAASSSAVRTVTVAQGTVTATVTADGSLESASSASAAFATAGTVTAVSVKVGQKVTAGQLLARVDDAAAKRALALARANLEAADEALDRAAEAGTDTGAATTAVASAQLAVDDANAAVTGTRLTAPMSGTVIAVNGTVGSSTSAAAETANSADGGFVEIADLGDLQVTAAFGEADATKLAAGQDATISWSALPDATSTGRVIAVDPSATSDNGVVSYGTTVSVDTLPEGAKPGQSVSVTVTTGTADNITYVNAAAVTMSGGRHTVTVRNADGTTETRAVDVGLAADDAYQIVSGLAVGEQVILPETDTQTSTGISGERQGPPERLGGGGGPP